MQLFWDLKLLGKGLGLPYFWLTLCVLLCDLSVEVEGFSVDVVAVAAPVVNGIFVVELTAAGVVWLVGNAWVELACARRGSKSTAKATAVVAVEVKWAHAAPARSEPPPMASMASLTKSSLIPSCTRPLSSACSALPRLGYPTDLHRRFSQWVRESWHPLSRPSSPLAIWIEWMTLSPAAVGGAGQKRHLASPLNGG